MSGDLRFKKTNKVIKGSIGLNFDTNCQIACSQDPLPSVHSTQESKLEDNAHSFNKGPPSRHWIPKGSTLAIICFLGVTGCSFFVFVHWHGLALDKETSSESLGITSFCPVHFKLTSNQLEARVIALDRQMKDPIELNLPLSLHNPLLCNPKFSLLKVFMYDLPSEFHFGLIEDFQPSPDANDVWPRNLSNLPSYPGGLNQQHSVEYWLTADILTSDQPHLKEVCTAVRVKAPEDANIFYVPFFASLSWIKFFERHKNGHDRNGNLQLKLVKFLEEQRPWQEFGGRNHIFVIHHPNALAKVRHKLGSSIFILNDFGRLHNDVANMEKDIIAPYKHIIPSFTNDSTTFESRKTLLFFQGTIARKKEGIIRRQMYKLLRNKDGVHFATGNTHVNGIKSATAGMRNSKYCLHLAGDTPSSTRFFDAIASHCVPVVISDNFVLPFADALNYSEFCIFIRAADALKQDFVLEKLQNIPQDKWSQMWLRLQTVSHHFEYQHPTLPMDAVDMIWRAIAKRVLIES